MCPRSYKLGKRKAAIDETRLRIIEAARQLLADESNAADLSMEAIARRADVSRLTIYYQFRSRPGLLEALYDQLAARGDMRQMAQVFHETDPTKMLEKMVGTFMRFWASDPVVIRRLRAMSGLDPEIATGIRARDSRRQHIAGEILRRFISSRDKAVRVERQKLAADVISALTSFETYDALSRAGHADKEILQTVLGLIRAAMASM
jgi:AcrR family transcriptional regulator